MYCNVPPLPGSRRRTRCTWTYRWSHINDLSRLLAPGLYLIQATFGRGGCRQAASCEASRVLTRDLLPLRLRASPPLQVQPALKNLGPHQHRPYTSLASCVLTCRDLACRACKVLGPGAVIELHVPLNSSGLSMCLCTLQVHRALGTGDPQAMMALRGQLEDVVSSKWEQEGELQARLEVGSFASIAFTKGGPSPSPNWQLCPSCSHQRLCHAGWAQAGRSTVDRETAGTAAVSCSRHAHFGELIAEQKHHVPHIRFMQHALKRCLRLLTRTFWQLDQGSLTIAPGANAAGCCRRLAGLRPLQEAGVIVISLLLKSCIHASLEAEWVHRGLAGEYSCLDETCPSWCCCHPPCC